MGSVNLAGQQRSYYDVGRESKKFWTYLVWYIINTMPRLVLTLSPMIWAIVSRVVMKLMENYHNRHVYIWLRPMTRGWMWCDRWGGTTCRVTRQLHAVSGNTTPWWVVSTGWTSSGCTTVWAVLAGGKGKSVKRFERSNGLDTALYKKTTFTFTVWAVLAGGGGSTSSGGCWTMASTSGRRWTIPSLPTVVSLHWRNGRWGSSTTWLTTTWHDVNSVANRRSTISAGLCADNIVPGHALVRFSGRKTTCKQCARQKTEDIVTCFGCSACKVCICRTGCSQRW